MHHTEIINQHIKEIGAKSYLEIGVYDTSHNFNKIECEHKVGVDPANIPGVLNMTSDEFFAQNTETFDVIFIDGLHENEQVRKDIANSLKILNPGGVIILHDCNPTTEEMQIVPRQQGEWTGDVWKAFVYYRRTPTLEMWVNNSDYGVGVIKRGEQEPLVVDEADMTYANLEANRKYWLNLK